MSGFKRRPSKVFWDQMALLEDERFAMRSNPPRDGLNERLREEEDEEEEDDENSISKSENDTTDDANITAIHIPSKSDENSKRDTSRNSLARVNESVASHRYVEIINFKFTIYH